MPVRTGYLEAQARASTLTGVAVGLEAGLRLRGNLALFGAAQWTLRESYAGVGARLTFGL
ncbi:hypothetical protein [Myxococcus sp. CA040A]|uniref:hypothetical protein n=1 Tax=Myxococcus sp. CA040A TaxID=2741738 RepID=UPI00157B46FE|nr:hypothetical protein [Myxococcus sp. CA040A]NTX07034.1 hypothetical protein [Myxococcus sp. CA040A]